jgi:ribosomal protein S18 acetylase RimI-like enzyme
MLFLKDECFFSVLNNEVLNECKRISCGIDDLDEFFEQDVDNYTQQLLGKSYCFRLQIDSSTIVCVFTVSNSKLRVRDLPSSRKERITKNIPFEKRFDGYPAVLIGRLGVNIDYQRKGIGNELMEFIKNWFIDSDNKTGCRFIVVDALNSEKQEAINFYKKNGFEFIFSTEEYEKRYTKNNKLKTRSMYFDLIELKNKE